MLLDFSVSCAAAEVVKCDCVLQAEQQTNLTVPVKLSIAHVSDLYTVTVLPFCWRHCHLKG
ncbi:UNVERIFIED_CONTAM: hypothetical protein FKN15_043880 [Acipenser sinensis]